MILDVLAAPQSNKMLTYLAITAILITSTLAGIDAWQSPVYKYLFQFPLPRPPIKSPTKYGSSERILLAAMLTIIQNSNLERRYY